MRHSSKRRSFNRGTDQRRALLRALCVGLVRDGRITTTEAKAKELRPTIEKLVTTARKGTLAAHRSIVSKVGESAAKKLVDDIAPRFAKRAGGYTRITKLPKRTSDSALMAQIEFRSEERRVGKECRSRW